MKIYYQLTGLLLAAFIFSQGCTEHFTLFKSAENSVPLVLIVNHSHDATSMDLANQAAKPFEYAGITYLKRDMSSTQEIKVPNSVRVMYLATDIVEELSDEAIIEIVRYVAAGNQLVVLAPIYDERFAYLIGIREDADYITDSKAEGFHFFEHVFPNYKDKKFKASEPFLHYGFKASQFVADTTVIASAQNDGGYPAIIKREIGAGSVIYFNSSVMAEKSYRGLSFSAALPALESIPYRISNVSTIFLDDFPAPLYPKKMAPIDKEYDITHAEFVNDIWWPDMKKLADQFDIDYTAMLAFNYNAVVVPPFDFGEWENASTRVDGRNRNASSVIALDVKNSRHELGFHGYNHFSLWNQDWQNRAFMESSLRAAIKRWNIDNLGSFPVTYVPPTNNVDTVGLQAIRTAMPSIRYMSSLYLGDIEEGGGREFGPDPVAPELFAYPRITSGFIDNDISNFDQQSLFLYTGIWTHFIHPDDVFQVTQRAEDNYKSRNPLGLGWRSNETYDYGLYDVFRLRLEETLQRYPISRFLTVEESAPIVQKWLQTQSRYNLQDENISVITHSAGRDNKQKFWFNYVGKENQPLMEYALAEAGMAFHKSPIWDGALYQFSTTSDSLSLPLFQKAERDNNIDQVVERYKTMMTTSQLVEILPWQDTRLKDALLALRRNPGQRELQDSVINLAVEFDSVQLAIPILEERLIDSQLDTQDTKELLKFYGWVGESGRAYNFLDSLWSKYEDERVLAIHDSLINLFGIPNEQFEKRWLKRKLDKNPTDNSVLRRLADLSDSWAQKKNYLQDLIKLNQQPDSLFNYVAEQYIGNSKYEQLLELVHSSIDPANMEDKMLRYAHDFAYYYASNDDFTEAGMWAVKTDSISQITRLDWLLQQNRYSGFISQGEYYLQQNPRDDSLRKYVGEQLIYQNFSDEGYKILYPLFERQTAPEQTKQLVQNEISYMDYSRQKDFYERYPAFFTDEQVQSVEQNHRRFEGIKSGISTSLAADNYSQRTAETAFFLEWGNRRDVAHKVSLSERLVGIEIPELADNNVGLYHLFYQYRKSYENQMQQLTLGGGIYSHQNSLFPRLQGNYWWSGDMKYTSLQANLQPVYKASAVGQNIFQLKTGFYREEYWLSNNIQTAITLDGSWFTDNNFSYEASSKFYYDWPISTPMRKVRPIIDLSYADAVYNNSSGLPYYTPDRLFSSGAGLDLHYKDGQYNPEFFADLELMIKTSNQQDFFIVSSGNISKRFLNFWELSLKGYLSTSKVYRYNSVELNLSYIFPYSL